MSFQLPPWVKILFVGVGTALAIGAGVFAYRYFTYPVTLTVAAGSVDGYAVQVMSSIAGRLTATGSPVRLKVVSVDSAFDAAKAFATGKVDLAIIRADVGDLSEARTIVLAGHGVVMIVVPPGSSIDSIDALAGKTVGVVGGEPNHAVVDAMKQEYDLATKKVVFKDLALADVPKATAIQAGECRVVCGSGDRKIPFNRAHCRSRKRQEQTDADCHRRRRRNRRGSGSLRELRLAERHAVGLSARPGRRSDYVARSVLLSRE